MDKRVIFIEHHPDPRDARASPHLAARGFAIQWVPPFNGESLPAPCASLAGVVVAGGSANIDTISEAPYLFDEARWLEQCLKGNIPVLGICLGGQLLAHVLGAQVFPRADGWEEFGYYPIQPAAGQESFIPNDFFVFQAHSRGFEIPHDATLLACGDLFPNHAFRYGDYAYGLQFHPEVTPGVLRRWQDSDWAPWDNPGAQSREEQETLAPLHDPLIHHWFTGLLDGLFVSDPGRV